MEESTALVVRRIEEIERRDEAQILAAMAGELITEYTYSFRDSRGRHQRNLSWAGIREMAQFRGNIIVDEPLIEERDDHWRIVVKATDVLRNVSVWGGTHQPKIMRVKDTGTGELYEEADRFAFEKALSKAQRNAIKNLMPVTVIQEMIKRLAGERKESPKKPRQQRPLGEELTPEEAEGAIIESEDPPPNIPPRLAMMSEIIGILDGMGWEAKTRESWLAESGPLTLEGYTDEGLARVLQKAKQLKPKLV